MGVKIDLFDVITGTFKTWTFKTNNEGYMEMIINNNVMDTLYDIGTIRNLPHLIRTINKLVKCWGIESKNLCKVKF
jgi:hypothetical protein